MSVERAYFPYLNEKDHPVNFERKRLEFWLQKVPSDIRRMEYDLWKRYKILNQINAREFQNRTKFGKRMPVPGYSEEIQEKDWKEFRDSFLVGEERKNRFQDLINHIREDWENVLETNHVHLTKEEFGIVALEGSGFYGPRKADAYLSDVDIKILLRRQDGKSNFEIMPSIKNTNGGFPYHVIGCGETDDARFSRDEIHWLLYPHYPIVNSVENAALDKIIADLVQSTRDRSEEIKAKIGSLDARIEKKRSDYIDK